MFISRVISGHNQITNVFGAVWCTWVPMMQVGPTHIGWVRTHPCLDLCLESGLRASLYKAFSCYYPSMLMMIVKGLSWLSSPLGYVWVCWDNFCCSLWNINHLLILVWGCCWVGLSVVLSLWFPAYGAQLFLFYTVFYLIAPCFKSSCFSSRVIDFYVSSYCDYLFFSPFS